MQNRSRRFQDGLPGLPIYPVDQAFKALLFVLYSPKGGTKESSTLDANVQMAERQPEWLPFFEAAMRVGEFLSIDEVIYHAFNAWLAQLAPELRWRIAIDLYTNGEVSTGKTAQIAGLNYVVFEEKLREHKIPFQEIDTGFYKWRTCAGSTTTFSLYNSPVITPAPRG